MVCENDILEIPEEYKKMSEEELDKEIEKLYETMKDQNKGEVREKVAKLPVPEAEYENIVLKPSKYQKDMVSSLAERAEAVRDKRVNASVEIETVLNRLINRILIGEPKKVDGIKTQEVRIVYNFVREL